MKKILLRITSFLLAAIMMVGFGDWTFVINTDASAQETETPLGAENECDDGEHYLGLVGNIPACVNWNGDLHICENNFPDEKFREYLLNLPENMEGYFPISTVSQITDIQLTGDFYSKGEISSVKGIEYFESLLSLDCSYNLLTSLNISQNKKLFSLYCSDNQLTELDLSNNIDLIGLSCRSNQLTELDLSNNTALTNLSCESNQLTELDLSNNTALTNLSCESNQLTELDLSNNTALTNLSCGSNQLTELDLSNNTLLNYLICDRNQLSKLDLSSNRSLWYLNCEINQINDLDISENIALSSIECGSNQLTKLDLTPFLKLKYIGCYNNQLTELNLSNNIALTGLSCGYNQLTELDLSNNTLLNSLSCNRNQLTELDLSNNTALTNLSCGSNPLKKLNISNNLELKSLYCYDIGLTELDTASYIKLERLDCRNNQLTELDLSNNTLLNYCHCENNLLERLDVSKNTDLVGLYCNNNHLTNLEIINHSKMQTLNCSSNQLKSITLNNVPLLTDFRCSHNQLKRLDMTQAINLYTLYCDYNELESLDVSDCINLTQFYCSDNQLAELDLSNNAKVSIWRPISRQEKTVFLLSDTQNYVFNLGDIVKPENFYRVKSVVALTKKSGTIGSIECDFDMSTGLVSVERKKEIFDFYYCYDTQLPTGTDYTRNMLVSLDVLDHVHSFSEWQVRTPATCMVAGEEYRICECGEEEIRETAPLKHSFTNYVYDNNATCTTNGTETAKCDRCDATDTRETENSALGHAYSAEWTVISAPTCTDDGTERRECERCGYFEIRAISATGHTASAAVVENRIEATCTENGSYDEVVYCSVCNAEMRRDRKTIDSLAHDYSTEWTEDTAPTCTAAGSKSHHCTVCDSKADITEIPALGHSFGEWKEVKAATFSEDGESRRYCSVCDAFETRRIPKLSESHTHDFSGREEIISAATCTAEGSKRIYCTEEECGEYTVAVIGMTAHLYSEQASDEYMVSPATCSSKAVYCKSCSVCGIAGSETFEYGEFDMNNHVGGTYETVQKEATCEEDGVAFHCCSSCNNVLSTDVIDAIGHDWVIAEVVEAAPGKQGYTLYVCQNDPGHTYKGDFTDYPSIPGDINNNGYVDSDDAIYLLNHFKNPEQYPIDPETLNKADFNSDGIIDSDDAVYLLYHTLLPERFPLRAQM